GAFGRRIRADRPHVDDRGRAADRIGRELRRAAGWERLGGESRPSRRRAGGGQKEERAHYPQNRLLAPTCRSQPIPAEREPRALAVWPKRTMAIGSRRGRPIAT